MTKILKGIPLPPSNAGRKQSHPFAEMEVGDALDVPAKNFNCATAAAVYWRRKFPDRKFVGRTINENGRTVYRFWRTA